MKEISQSIPANAKYTSHEVQDLLFRILARKIQSNIVKKIKTSDTLFFFQSKLMKLETSKEKKT